MGLLDSGDGGDQSHLRSVLYDGDSLVDEVASIIDSENGRGATGC